MKPPWTVSGGQWSLSYRLCSHSLKCPCARASSQQPRGRTLPTDANRGHWEVGGKSGPQTTSARPYAPLRLRRALVSSCVERGGDQLLSPPPVRSVSPEPSSTPARHAGSPPPGLPVPTRRGSTPGPRVPRPRPVLTALESRDFPAPRGEPGRLRPLSFRLRNSLDRSRESVAEEVVERLCSSRLLRRTTMVSRCGSRNPL